MLLIIRERDCGVNRKFGEISRVWERPPGRDFINHLGATLDFDRVGVTLDFDRVGATPDFDRVGATLDFDRVGATLLSPNRFDFCLGPFGVTLNS
jgi:hypothetical protein